MSDNKIRVVQQSILDRIETQLKRPTDAAVGIEVANLSHAYNRLEDAQR